MHKRKEQGKKKRRVLLFRRRLCACGSFSLAPPTRLASCALLSHTRHCRTGPRGRQKKKKREQRTDREKIVERKKTRGKEKGKRPNVGNHRADARSRKTKGTAPRKRNIGSAQLGRPPAATRLLTHIHRPRRGGRKNTADHLSENNRNGKTGLFANDRPQTQKKKNKRTRARLWLCERRCESPRPLGLAADPLDVASTPYSRPRRRLVVWLCRESTLSFRPRLFFFPFGRATW